MTDMQNAVKRWVSGLGSWLKSHWVPLCVTLAYMRLEWRRRDVTWYRAEHIPLEEVWGADGESLALFVVGGMPIYMHHAVAERLGVPLDDVRKEDISCERWRAVRSRDEDLHYKFGRVRFCRLFSFEVFVYDLQLWLR